MLRAILALVWLSAVPHPAPRDTLRYDITFTGGDGVPRLEVVLHFRAGDSGSTMLRLPSRWAGQSGLYHAIRRLRVLSPAAELSYGPDSSSARVSHAPGAEVAVAYDVIQDWAGELTPGRRHRAIVQQTWFHVVGHDLLITPDLPEDRTVAVRLRWNGALPVGALTSFGGGAAQTFVGPLGRLTNALFLGGDYRLRTADIDGRPVAIAVRGRWRFSDSAFMALTGRIVRAERALWHDRDFPYYLVALTPWSEGFGGTRLEASFTLFADTTIPSAGTLAPLLAHELTHEWIGGGRLQPAPGLSEGSLYWFTEGFTNFYMTVLLRRMALMSPAAFADTVNWFLRTDATSPYAATSYDSIAGRFWTDRDAHLLPYVRGFLLALRLDARIRERTGGRRSLDDAMRRLLTAEHGRPVLLSESTIAAALAPDLPEAATEIARHVHEGERVRIPAGALGAAYRSATALAWHFDLGFDFEASRRGGAVTGVVPAGPAWSAGLRDGMRLKHYGIWFGQPDRKVVLRIAEADSTRSVSYLPRNGAVAAQQFLPVRPARR